MSDSEDSFQGAPKRRQKKRIRDDSSDEGIFDDDDGNSDHAEGVGVISSARDDVTLQQALVSLAGTPLSRNSRFVDVLFKSCHSWKYFALLEATDKLVAFDPNTRLWCKTPRQVHALFNDTLLKEARQLLDSRGPTCCSTCASRPWWTRCCWHRDQSHRLPTCEDTR